MYRFARAILGGILSVLTAATVVISTSSAAQAGPSAAPTPHSVRVVGYLRSVLAAPVPAPDSCAQQGIVHPVLLGGRLYAVSGGLLTAYDPGTGVAVWRTEPFLGFDGDIRGLVVSHGRVLLGEVGCDSLSDPAGYVEAYSTVDGAPEWRQQTSSALTSLAVSGNYVAETGTSVGSGEGTSVLRVATGSPVWTETGDDCADAGLAVEGNLVIHQQCSAQNGSSSLEADQLTTGAVAWSRAGAWLAMHGGADPSVGDRLYATSNGTVYDLDPMNGATRHTMTGAENVLAVDGLRVYATCGDGVICAYRADTGTKLWSIADPSTVMAALGGLLYTGSGPVIEASSGHVVVDLWFADPDPTALTVGDGRIAVVSDSRVLDLYGRAGS